MFIISLTSLHCTPPGSMQVVKLARLAFQLAALCFFAYQMGNAVSKYFKYSTMPLTENKDIADAKLPTIFICEKDQFDVKKAKLYEYGRNIDTFLSGIIEVRSEKLLTWESVDRTAMSFKDLIKRLFIADGTAFTADLSLQHAKHFKGANGFCEQYRTSASALSKTIKIRFFRGLKANAFEVFIVDPGRNLYYMINTGMVKGDRIEIKKQLSKQTVKEEGFVKAEKFKRYFFIHLEEVHQDPNDGRCTNYGKKFTFRSYAECIKNEQDKIFRPILGCKVPWLAARYQSAGFCKEEVNLTKENWDTYAGNISKIIMTTKTGQPEPNKECLEPCVGLNIYSKLTAEESTGIDEIVLHFQQSVQVITHVQAYGIMDLWVEVGGSLGLWVGISAVGIFDLLLQVFEKVIRMKM